MCTYVYLCRGGMYVGRPVAYPWHCAIAYVNVPMRACVYACLCAYAYVCLCVCVMRVYACVRVMYVRCVCVCYLCDVMTYV